jgi:hypothetical protein
VRLHLRHICGLAVTGEDHLDCAAMTAETDAGQLGAGDRVVHGNAIATK